MMICFNPRTRKGCDSLSQSENGIISVVSIHAPVKDATRNEFYNPHICDVSIHAPVKDATWKSFRIVISQSFNPRTRKGCDNRLKDVSVSMAVSIHVPVKDATGVNNGFKHYFEVSIHAPVKDATDKFKIWDNRCMFQSTHP